MKKSIYLLTLLLINSLSLISPMKLFLNLLILFKLNEWSFKFGYILGVSIELYLTIFQIV